MRALAAELYVRCQELMKQRRGERVGWIGGWLGALLWLLVLSVLWLFLSKLLPGLVGLGLFSLGVLLVFALAPWKHPETKYWKLMLPMLLFLLFSAAIGIWLHGGLGAVGLNWSSIIWMPVLIIPFATMGGRRWKDGDT